MSTKLLELTGLPIPRARKVYTALVIFVLHLITGCVANQDRGMRTATPVNFQASPQVNLSSRAHEAEILGEFSLTKTTPVTVSFTLQNIDSTYFDLSLVGPGSNSFLILHGEDYQTDAQGGGTWERRLPPGEYRLVLTADQSPGILAVNWKYR